MPASWLDRALLKGRAARLVIRAVAVGVLVAAIGLAGGFSWLDNHLADLRFSLRTRPASPSLVLVDIDAKSLAAVGVWPWDRDIHARLIELLDDLGARQIAFDVDFSTRSNPHADAAFAKALKEAKAPVFLAAFRQPKAAGKADVLVNRPIDLFADGWPALINVPVDGDGLVRRFPAALAVGGERLDAMPALIAGADAKAISGADAAGGEIGIDYSIDRAGLSHVSVSDVLYGRVDPAAIAGKTALVGATALELHDYFLVPRWGMIPGAEIVALAAETLQQGRSLAPLPALPIALPLMALALLLSLLPTRRALVALVLVSLIAEAVAAYLQVMRAEVLGTAMVHVAVAGLLVAVLIREYGLRRVLLTVARLEKANSDRILGRVFDNGFDGIVLLDENDAIVRHNLQPGGLIAAGAALTLSALPAGLRQAVETVRRRAAAGDEAALVVDVETPASGDAEIFECAVTAFEVETHRFRRGKARYVCVTLRNVTERRRVAERIRHMALHDALTGLGNRAGLLEAIEGRAGALLSFDIARFGKLNAWLGNAVGDKILIEVSRRMAAFAGRQGILARVGADEFAIFLGNGADAAALVAAARAALQPPFVVNDHRLFVDFDFGLAGDADGTLGAELLLRHANLALAKAKREEGAFAAYDRSLEGAERDRLTLEQDLRRAIEEHELVAHYQPQVALTGAGEAGEIVGAEMLVRWRHPTRGLVPPSLFVPIAEESGLIHKVTAWAIRQACADAAAWPKPIRLAVNVSAIDLGAAETGIPATLKAALAESGLAPDRLDIEITESVLVERSEAVLATLADIRALGVGIALDDFGTGYSSLSYLSRLPFTKLKIDKSFVDGLPNEPDATALVDGIIRLAHGVRLAVVAEGIESEPQRHALAALGCDIGQGYLFSRPVTDEAMRALLAG